MTAIPDTARLKGSDPDLTQDTIQRSQSLPIASLPSTLTTSAAREIRKLSGSSSLGTVQNRAVDVMIAEDNPISQKILETLLTRMGCRCVCVNDGAEALAASMGDLREYLCRTGGTLRRSFMLLMTLNFAQRQASTS